MPKKFMMAITEEDGTIEAMTKTLRTSKGDTVILALNLLNYVLVQRKAGKYLTVGKGKDKTRDILEQATEGTVTFSLHQ